MTPQLTLKAKLDLWIATRGPVYMSRLDYELPFAGRRLAGRLSQSPLAASLLNEAKGLHIKLVPSLSWEAPKNPLSTVLPGVRFHPDAKHPGGRVSFAPGLPGVTDLSVVRMLRQGIVQSNQRLGGPREPLSPAEQLRWNRLVAADAEMTAIAVAYQLKLAGKTDAWKRLLDDPQRYLLAETYEGHMSLGEDQARRAGFDVWFSQPQLVADIDQQTILTLETRRYFWQTPKPATREFDNQEAIDTLGAYLAAGRPLDDKHYLTVKGTALQARLTALEHAQLVLIDKATAKAKPANARRAP